MAKKGKKVKNKKTDIKKRSKTVPKKLNKNKSAIVTIKSKKTKLDQSKTKLKKRNKSTMDMNKRKKLKRDDEDNEEEEEEEEDEDEEGEEGEDSEDDESDEEGGKKGKKSKNKKGKGKGKLKQNRSVVLKNKKKLEGTKGKLKQNRSVVLKKKNLLDKTKRNKNQTLKKLKQNKRSQSVKTRKPFKNNKMLRTNRSEIIKGKNRGFFKNKNKNIYNRTTRSEQKFYKKKNKIEINKKRSRTPNVSQYKNKLWKNNKNLKKNKFSKTDISIRTIPKNKNFNNTTQRSFNTYTIRGKNKYYHLNTEGNDSLKRKNFISGYKRVSEGGLRPITIRGNKFMQNTQNFFNPHTKRSFNLFRQNFDYNDEEREKGFFNRITLYPKNDDSDENKSLRGDNLNPYSTNWPSSFLKIGYSSGFYYDDYQDGVPILRLKKIRNKIILPPIKNSRYSHISEKNDGALTVNFNYMSRQERINYILNTENTNKDNNVFTSYNARRKLLDKFHIKGFDLPVIHNKKEEEEEEDEDEEEEEDDEGEEKEEDEREGKDDDDNDDKNEDEEDDGSSHPNEIE